MRSALSMHVCNFLLLGASQVSLATGCISAINLVMEYEGGAHNLQGYLCLMSFSCQNPHFFVLVFVWCVLHSWGLDTTTVISTCTLVFLTSAPVLSVTIDVSVVMLEMSFSIASSISVFSAAPIPGVFSLALLSIVSCS